jgi:hypothetical protein
MSSKRLSQHKIDEILGTRSAISTTNNKDMIETFVINNPLTSKQAILELAHNSYDAKCKNIKINFETYKKKIYLRFTDDGHGVLDMNNLLDFWGKRKDKKFSIGKYGFGITAIFKLGKKNGEHFLFTKTEIDGLKCFDGCNFNVPKILKNGWDRTVISYNINDEDDITQKIKNFSLKFNDFDKGTSIFIEIDKEFHSKKITEINSFLSMAFPKTISINSFGVNIEHYDPLMLSELNKNKECFFRRRMDSTRFELFQVLEDSYNNTPNDIEKYKSTIDNIYIENHFEFRNGKISEITKRQYKKLNNQLKVTLSCLYPKSLWDKVSNKEELNANDEGHRAVFLYLNDVMLNLVKNDEIILPTKGMNDGDYAKRPYHRRIRAKIEFNIDDPESELSNLFNINLKKVDCTTLDLPQDFRETLGKLYSQFVNNCIKTDPRIKIKNEKRRQADKDKKNQKVLEEKLKKQKAEQERIAKEQKKRDEELKKQRDEQKKRDEEQKKRDEELKRREQELEKKKKRKRKSKTKTDENILKQRQNNKTNVLKVPIGELYIKTEIDHIVELKDGGSDILDNYQIILTELHDIKSRDKSDNKTFYSQIKENPLKYLFAKIENYSKSQFFSLQFQKDIEEAIAKEKSKK